MVEGYVVRMPPEEDNFKALSLLDSCINALAFHFDTILPILNKDENIPVKALLQKNFLDALFSKVKGPLRKKHALFFINRHLRSLDLSRFSTADIDDVIEIMKRKGSGILKVQFSQPDADFTKKTLMRIVRSLPRNLKSLSFAGTKARCSIEVLKTVRQKCLILEELVLFGCSKVTDDVIEAVFSNGHQSINNTLRKLDLNFTCVTSTGVVCILNNCSNLTEILHQNVDEALQYIYCCLPHLRSKKFNLEKLELKMTLVKFGSIMCPNVKSLSLTEIVFQEDVEYLKGFEKLEDITVFNYFFQPVILSSFFESRGSTLLNVSIVGDFVIVVESVIQFCPRIKCLNLCDVNVEINEGSNFDPERFLLPNLQKLTVRYEDLTNKAPLVKILLACAPNLEEFSLSCFSGFSHEFIEAITVRELPFLKELHIYTSGVDAQSVRMFLSFAPNLKAIHVVGSTDISRADCENFERLKIGLRIKLYKEFVF